MAQNFDLKQNGPELQERIDQVFPNRDNIAAEGERAQGAEQELEAAKATRQELQAETTRATEKENDLQAQINDIVSGGATVSLTATPQTIFVGVGSPIELKATTNKQATSIDITGGNLSDIHGSGTSKICTDILVPEIAGTAATYIATFVISGNTRTASKSVTAVYPIFYGAQADFDAESLAQYATPTTAVARAYTVQLDSTRRKFYLRVPKQGVAQVKSVVMGSGSEASPVSGGIVAALGDENYNVWASDDGFTGDGSQVFTVS